MTEPDSSRGTSGGREYPDTSMAIADACLCRSNAHLEFQALYVKPSGSEQWGVCKTRL